MSSVWRAASEQAAGDEIELVLLFDRGEPGFESVVDKTNFSLFCTPAINLFAKRADRIHLSDNTHEYHVVADRTRPMDFEIYEVTRCRGAWRRHRQRSDVPAALHRLRLPS